MERGAEGKGRRRRVFSPPYIDKFFGGYWPSPIGKTPVSRRFGYVDSSGLVVVWVGVRAVEVPGS